MSDYRDCDSRHDCDDRITELSEALERVQLLEAALNWVFYADDSGYDHMPPHLAPIIREITAQRFTPIKEG